MVHAEPISMRVGVGKDSDLQHLIRRVTNPGHNVGRRKGSLFHLGKVVFGIAIQLQDANFNQRIIAMRPNLGKIEGIPAVSFRFILRHNLDAETPTRIIATLNVFEKISLG
jgi:hypothetical protein